MALLVKIFHDLLDSREIVNPQFADIAADRSEVQKCNGNFSSFKFLYEA